jgi:putative membrane protein
MIQLIVKWVINGLALFIVSKILPGFQIENFSTALVAVVIIGLVNVFIKPVLLLLTLPINILSLGLFTFVINALLLLLAAAVTPGFKIDGLLTALLGSILLTIISTVLHSLIT